MKNQGVPDEEIASKLREDRVSPKDINDAFSQAKIKSAVSNTEETQTSNAGDMQPSIMKSPPTSVGKEDVYIPQTQESSSQPTYPQEEYYPQEGYDEYSAPTGADTDTMIEIAEQVFSEKMRKIQKQLEKLNEFQTISQVKIDSTAERLKRIEKIIDNLQISILDKVGAYGKNLGNIKKEMTMMQSSFKKTRKHPTKKSVKHTTPKKKISKR